MLVKKFIKDMKVCILEYIKKYFRVSRILIVKNLLSIVCVYLINGVNIFYYVWKGKLLLKFEYKMFV